MNAKRKIEKNTARYGCGSVLKNKMSRTLFLLFACLLTALPMALQAETVSGTTGSLTWTLDTDSGTLTISGTGEMPYYSSSSDVPWNNYRASISTVDIGNSVTTIGSYAFSDCSSLTSVTIPNSLTSIGYAAFSDCSGLTSVTIPNLVTSIGGYAFTHCSGLTSVTIPNSVTAIGSGTFSGCSSLTSVTIPNSVTSIGYTAFSSCSGLTSITIPESVTSIGEFAFSGCSGLTSVIIPESVPSIGNNAFFGCSGLTAVTIPESVTSIGNSAFQNCIGLTSVIIPNLVTSIGEFAFSGCSSLTSVTIPDLVISIGNYAFSTCSGLTSVTIPNSVTSIGNYAFFKCSGLTSVIIPNSVTSIGDRTFDGCSSLTSVIISNSVTSIGIAAFLACSSLTSITIPDSVTSIGEFAFSGCSGLTSVTIPNSVTSIGESAFNSCSSLTSVVIPESVPSIGSYAFFNCSSLTSVTIPNSVTSIGESAFRNCSNLTSITCLASIPPPLGTDVFSGINLPLATLYVPSGTQTLYETAEVWKDFGTILETTSSLTWSFNSDNGTLTISGTGAMPDYGYYNVVPWNSYQAAITTVDIDNSITSIGSHAFADCSSLTSVTIPNSATSIGVGAFYGCSSLTSVTIPNSVTSIGGWAFFGCGSLTSATIPDLITSIGNSAFFGCSSLTSVTIPELVTSIGNSAFLGCSSLTSVIIPESVTSIGSSAFSGCSSLTSVTIPDSVTSIEGETFYDCSSLTSVTIPNSVTSIGQRAFHACSGLASVTIPNSVTSIGANAFQNCSSLTSVEIPNLVTSIASGTFDGCSGLTSVIIPNSVTSIGGGTFSQCSNLASVTIPNSVTSIGANAFQNCSSLTSVEIPNLVTSIAPGTFDGCIGLTSVIIPNSVTSIGGLAFQNCNSLIAVTIPESVTSIEFYAFYGCSSLTSVTIPNSVTEIEDGIFSQCSSLTSVTIPNSVTSIGRIAFMDCSGVTSITIPNSVTSIGELAFAYCFGLTSVTCLATIPPPLETSVFYLVDLSVATLYVPSGTQELYKTAIVWKDFGTIEETVPTLKLEAGFAESLNLDLYRNMSLELSRDTVVASHIVGNASKYLFYVSSGTYSLALKNRYGTVLGEINDIEMDRDTAVTFASLAPVYKVKLNVTGSSEHNLSGKPSVKWYDSNETLLSTGDSISGVAAGMELKYRIVLDENWGKVYVAPPVQTYTVVAGNNTVEYNLQEIPLVTLEGRVKAENGSWLSGATVTLVQLLNGKYPKNLSVQTDMDGRFTLQAYNDSSTVVVSYPGYFSQSLVLSNFNETTDLGMLSLSSVQGAVLSLKLTYTPSVAAGETPVSVNGYSDYRNVDYALFNLTQGRAIDSSVLQYPEIVLLDALAVDDEIRIRASSRVNAFVPVQALVQLDTALQAEAQLNIVQRGYIRAVYSESANESNTGVLYDSAGHRTGQYVYTDNRLLTGELPDGNYRLVSMASHPFFNTMSNLSAFTEAGLTEGVDYVLQTLAVESGKITETEIPSIPAPSEHLLSYTGANTSFTVSKSQAAVGNYLTLRSEIDFKEEYLSGISNVKLIVELPENCEFIHGSVVVGNEISTAYTFVNNRLTLPLANWSEIVKLCIAPLRGGDYAPSAFVQFDLNGQNILQPIGSAPFKVENLSIKVPKITAQKEIIVSGTTTGKSEVKIYDDDILIGQTRALANGKWTLLCELYNPLAFSYHYIHAEIITPQGLNLISETKRVVHDARAIELDKTTMIHGPSETVFDFQNPSTNLSSYSYNPYYSDFTFKIAFVNNDPDLISEVLLDVLTTAGNIVTLVAVYDPEKGIWVATGRFSSDNLPVNVNVRFQQTPFVFYIMDGSESRASISDMTVAFYKAFHDYQECGGEYANIIETVYLPRIKMLLTMPAAQGAVRLYSTVEAVEGKALGLALYDFLEASNMSGIGEQIESNYSAAINHMKAALQYMVASPCNNLGNYVADFPLSNAVPLIDPSGYVYEAVPSNRLEGVMTTIYYKTPEGDIYLWDAEDYGQENPLFTDKNGEYGWDVPAGIWQVKYEKEGYKTVYSEWLPVPPPQLDVNMSKVQPVQPEVIKTQGYESGVNIEFDKFMQPAFLRGEYISLTRNGAPVSGSIVLLNEEAGANTTFASKVRFVPETPFSVDDEVILTVKREVRSYADIEMAEDFVQRVEINRETTSLTAPAELEIALHSTRNISVLVEPREAAAGKKVVARSVSSSIVTVTGEAILDAAGEAILEISAELPGATVIYLSVDETDLKAEIAVRVTIPVTGVSLNKTATSLTVNDSERLLATVEPANAPLRTLIWSSSNTAVATVNNSGLVSAVSAGTATIVVRTEEGGYTATCVITVAQPVTGVALNKTAATIAIGAIEQLVATVAPDNAANTDVSWSSSNTAVATVSDSGLVTAVSAGAANIRVTTGDGGYTAICAITVGPQVTGVTLNKATTTIPVGLAEQLTASVLPPNAPNRTVTWSSSNTAVANVNGSGLVSAVSAGAATITVTTQEGGYTATCAVTVAPAVAVTSIGLDNRQTAVNVGSSVQLTASIAPENATNKAVTWSSSNEAVARVSAEGLVTAVSAGRANIRVTTVDGGHSDICAVTVVQPVTGVLLNKTATTINVGNTEQLTASVAPDNATNKTLIWSSSNTAVATVSDSGMVTAVSVGAASIRVTTQEGGYTDSCAITVVQPVTGVSLNKSVTSIAIGATEQLSATVAPDNASNKTVSWNSSNTAVATVSDSGLLTAVSAGTATITVTTADGRQTDICAVTVVQPATGVTLNKAETTIIVGNTEQLTESLIPEDATNKAVSWSSSNTAVATVSDAGLITAASAGTATVTVSTEDGEHTATCVITVVQPVTGVSLDKTETTINVNATEQLSASIAPENATNKAITWSSSNEAVATVSDNGLVTAVSIGTADITVSTEDGGHTATCAVTVNDLPITFTTLALDGGVKVALYRNVRLRFTFSGGVPTHFRTAESEAAVNSAVWQAYNAASLLHTFASAAHGYKTVYAQLKNGVGETEVRNAVIIYKPEHPKQEVRGFTINAGAWATESRTVSLNHSVINAVPTLYSASENPLLVGKEWLPYKALPQFTLSNGVGLKEVYFAVANAADTSDIVSSQIWLDEPTTKAGKETGTASALSVKLYPNPVKTAATVEVDGCKGKVQVSVYDVSGRMYLSRTFDTQTFSLDLTDCPSGILLVRIVNDGNSVIKKVIKN